MAFEKLLFISYAHIDNRALPPHQEGWISRFHASLEAMLSMRIGRQAAIWRDDKLRGNDVFAEEIVDQFDRTALLVSILTPRYLESEWCTRELREFCERAQRTGGVVRANKSRVFKVLKAPVESQASLPAPVQDVLGYPFFTYEDGAPLELDAAYGERFAQDYNRRVCKLAWDLSQTLQQLENAARPADERAVERPVVYLAECSHDRSEFREMLEAELKLHGCTVLPDQSLPLADEAACTEVVRQQLARSRLSIHLVGCTPGAVPDGPAGEPLVALQNRLAAEQSRAHGLARLIWMPAGTRSEQPAHQAFIDALQNDEALQFGADLLVADLEEFKAAVHTTLRRLETAAEPTPQAPASTRTMPLVYLLGVEKDRKASVPLRRYLREQGIDVELPAFEGDAAAIRAANKALLEACDAVVVFYGAGDEAWKRSTDAERKKVVATLERACPPDEYTVLAEPRTGDKDDLLDLQEPGVIDALGGFDPAALAPLVEALRARRAAS